MTPFPRADYGPLARYTPDRSPVDVDLSDNTNQWGAHPAALERLRALTSDDLRGYPQPYADELREAVAERFGVGTECVTTGVGSDDILDMAFRAGAGHGASVAFPGPTFAMVPLFARMNGMETRVVPWREAAAEPRTLLEGDPAVIYVCRPNNPTGELLPEEWVERLLGYRGDDGALLVLDEAYAEFSKDTLIDWATRVPRLLVARTASKAYGLAGVRCGFAVGQPEVVIELEKSRGPYKVTQLAAAAMAAALRDTSGWLERTVEECLENRERLLGELRARGLRPFESRTNFVCFAAPSGDARGDAAALRALGISVRPFSGLQEVGEGLRATVGRWDQMERLLGALDAIAGQAREEAM